MPQGLRGSRPGVEARASPGLGMVLNKLYFKYWIKTLFFRKPPEVPLYLFAYHKVGSKFLARIFREICWQNGWRFASLSGLVTRVPRRPDVIVFNHSLVNPAQIAWPFRGVHLVRDPRDVLVSSYLYHRRCAEAWCINDDLGTDAPITYPRISRMQEHRSEEWKARYLQALGEKSYQENLLQLNQWQGLVFECERYAGWTIEAMRRWDYENPAIMEVKFEDLMSGFDDQFRAIFEFLGFRGRLLDIAMAAAAKEDLNRKSAAEISSDPHIASRQTSKWKNYFDRRLDGYFSAKYGDVVRMLGYE